MAYSTTARRRLSLLAGSSLALATLASATTVALLAPTAARAANECGGVNPATNGGTADVYDCTGSQAAISYTTSGALTLRMNNGVATTTGGVAVTASGADTVTISRIDTPAGTGDPSLVATGAGSIGVSIASTGTGAISVDLTDTDTGDAPLVISGTANGVRLSGGATTGTALGLTTTNGQITATAGVGVQAISNNTTTGNIVLTLGGGVSGTTGGIQGIVNGTGTQTIALSAQSATVSGGDVAATTGPAVQMTTVGTGNGAATLTVGGGRLVRANGAANAVVDFTNANAARTVTNNGTIRSNDTAATGYDDLLIQVGPGTGAVTIANTTLNTVNPATGAFYGGAVLNGRLVLLNSGNATITNGAVARAGGGSVWHVAGANALGSGNTTLTNSSSSYIDVVGGVGTTTLVNAMIATNAGGVATTLDFGAGTDAFNNRGLLAVGEGAQGAATLTILGLETWTNFTSKVLFGANSAYTGSDGAANDRIVAVTTFNGTSLTETDVPTVFSTFFMDVNFAGSQATCSTAVMADCLDIRGGVVTGQTNIVVNTVGTTYGLGGRIVLVDAQGGTTSKVNFVLDPTSPGYSLDDQGQAAIDAGVLHYTLGYDVDDDRFFLMGAPDGEALELGALPSLARAGWDLATGTWFDRHGDLRPGLGRERGGAWLKMATGVIDQEMVQTYSADGLSFDYDTGYNQDLTAIVGGADLVWAGDEQRGFVLGATLGYLDTDTDFVRTSTEVELRGTSLGAYATYISGPIFLDVIVNGAKFDLAWRSADLGLASSDGQATSIGFQAEAGWSYHVPDMAVVVEPLVSLSYVRTLVDDLSLSTLALSLDDTANLRLGAGLRVYGDVDEADWTTRFSFTSRVLEEMDGVTEGTLDGPGFTLPLDYDDASDQLGEIGFAASALGIGDRLSLQLGVRMQFSRDYENRQVSLSARYAW